MQCRWCKKAVKAFYMIRYSDLVGWCSEGCLHEQKARDKALKEAEAKKPVIRDFQSEISHER